MLTKHDLTLIEELLDRKLEKKLKPIWRELKQLRKDINVVVSFFDQDVADLRERTERLERRTGLIS